MIASTTCIQCRKRRRRRKQKNGKDDKSADGRILNISYHHL